MKLLFFSDVHGSPGSIEKFAAEVDRFQPDQLILLGDVLYHGPRNPLAADYAPPRVVELLNGWSSRILAVRGNCDCEVDQMLLTFPIMAEYSLLLADGRKFFLTHGHHWNPEKLPPLAAGSVFAFGHTHLPLLEREASGVTLFNPGSVTLPKGGYPASLGRYGDGVLSVVALESGEVLSSLRL